MTGIIGARAALTPGTELGVSSNIPGFVGGTIFGTRVSLASCPYVLTLIAESDIYAEIPDETLRRPGGSLILRSQGGGFWHPKELGYPVR